MTIPQMTTRTRITPTIILVLALVLGWVSSGPAQAASVTTTFQASAEDIANPERGFYRHHRCDRPAKDRLDKDNLTRYRVVDKRTLILCVFYLREAIHSPISDGQLAFFNQQAATVKAAGLKMVVRFAYTDEVPMKNAAGQDEIDADLPTVRTHITQLKPFFENNKAVIAAVQIGFIGKWGEGASSTSFGDETLGPLTPQQWADRKEVALALLAAVPSNRMIQMRTPQKKQMVFGTTPLAPSAAYRASAAARTGHHNDCFLSNASDSGTYRSPRTADYNYLKAETEFLPMGGETCWRESNPNEPRQECASAQQELRELHWSYLNWDYDQRVTNKWMPIPNVRPGCLDTITRQLGYRLALVDATLPTSTARGGALPVRFRVSNSGYATPFNERLTYLVLRHSTTGQTVRLRINTDARRWTAGQTTTVSQTLTAPATLPVGTYTAALQVSDATTALATNPAYCVQFANNGVWDAQAGTNKLSLSLTVT